MTEHKEKQRIESTDPKMYFFIMPNFYDDCSLDTFAFRLLAHYVRVGTCYEGLRTTAKICNMSHPTVIRARNTLVEKGLIRVHEQEEHDTLLIEVVNIWGKNIKKYDDEKEKRGGRDVYRGGREIERGGRDVYLKNTYKEEPSKKNSNETPETSETLGPIDLLAQGKKDSPEYKASRTEHEAKTLAHRHRAAKALKMGMSEELAITHEFANLLCLTPNWKTKTNQQLLLWIKERPQEQTVGKFAEWWYANDWRGQKGQAPTMNQVRTMWTQAFKDKAEQPKPAEVY